MSKVTLDVMVTGLVREITNDDKEAKLCVIVDGGERCYYEGDTEFQVTDHGVLIVHRRDGNVTLPIAAHAAGHWHAVYQA